jgi:hypothetical protein
MYYRKNLSGSDDDYLAYLAEKKKKAEQETQDIWNTEMSPAAIWTKVQNMSKEELESDPDYQAWKAQHDAAKSSEPPLIPLAPEVPLTPKSSFSSILPIIAVGVVALIFFMKR